MIIIAIYFFIIVVVDGLHSCSIALNILIYLSITKAQYIQICNFAFYI